MARQIDVSRVSARLRFGIFRIHSRTKTSNKDNELNVSIFSVWHSSEINFRYIHGMNVLFDVIRVCASKHDCALQKPPEPQFQ